MRPRSVAGLLLAVAAPPAAGAQEAEPPGRAAELLQEAFRAEVVYPQARRELQGTIGFDYQRDPGFRIWETVLLIEFGLTDRLQLAAGLPFRGERVAPAAEDRGLGRPEIGVLFAVLPALDPVALSAEIDVGLPALSGDDAGVEWGGSLIAAVRAGPAQVHAGVGVEVEDGDAIPVGGLVGIYPLGRWRLLLEASGFHEGETVAFLTPGVVLQVMDDLELAVGVPIPVTRAAPGTNLVVKLTLEAGL